MMPTGKLESKRGGDGIDIDKPNVVDERAHAVDGAPQVLRGDTAGGGHGGGGDAVAPEVLAGRGHRFTW